MEELPDELLVHILGFLDESEENVLEEEDEDEHWAVEGLRALVSVRATSRRLRAVSDAAGLWRRLYARRFLAHSPFTHLQDRPHPPDRLADEDRERALLSCWPSEERWREAFAREARWSSGKNVQPAVARIPDQVALTTGRNTLVDERDPEKPVIFVSCGSGRIHSFQYDRSHGAGAELRKKKVYSVPNVGMRAILGVMRIKDAYMTGLHQTDELLVARAHGTIKVFRKGSKWAKLGVSTGQGYPTLAINRERMWMVSNAWGRPGEITLHDLGAAREVSKFTLPGLGPGNHVPHDPGMISKHDHLIIGSPSGLALLDLRSGKMERDLTPENSVEVNSMTSAQFEEDSDASSFLVTSYNACSSYVYNWDSLELQREVYSGGYEATFRRGIVALATAEGAHIADVHSSRAGSLTSGIGTSEAAYADWRRVIVVGHAVDEKRIIIHDLATSRQRRLEHPGGTEHSLGSAVTDDLLVTASKNTVALWDFASSSSSSKS